jgi:hypothetical protein
MLLGIRCADDIGDSDGPSTRRWVHPGEAGRSMPLDVMGAGLGCLLRCHISFEDQVEADQVDGDRLAVAAGIEDFDTWAATFGEVTSGVELTPDSTTFRIKSRFAKFTNVPELLTMLHVAADVKTAEDLGLPTPALAGGDPETVVVPSSPELAALVAELGARAEAVRSRAVAPEDDNMLKISGDGRAAALDLRLVGRARPDGPTKIDVAAERIAAIWAEHRDDRFLDAAGRPHPRPGALQLVFCELGTPSERWNVYDELRAQLVARGLPDGAIRFIHEAKDDRAKAELFAACRAGTVAVLIGSTEKMGVGTNVQDRAIALHHLDCPWRPADLAQRDGPHPARRQPKPSGSGASLRHRRQF